MVGWQVVNQVVLHAGNTIINPNGTFVYSGAPAAGNLIASITPATGTDDFGNKYLDQVTTYGAGIATQLTAGQVIMSTGSLAAGWTQQAQIFISGNIIELAPAAGGGVVTPNNTLDNGAGNMSVGGTLTSNGNFTCNQNAFIGNGSTLANLNLSPKMAIPPNSPLSGASSIAQIAAFCNSLVTSLENHGMMT